MNDLIQGLKFISIADFVYKPAPGYYEDPWRNVFNNIAPGLLIGYNSIAVMPELVKNWDISNAKGVCSDYLK